MHVVLSHLLCAALLSSPVPASSIATLEPPPAVTRAVGEKHTPDKAIVDGLVWLARHQAADGTWSTPALAKVCSPPSACNSDYVEAVAHYDSGLTALSVLAFLRTGYSPASKKEIGDAARGRFVTGDVVRRALEAMKKQQSKTGYFTKQRAFLYNEAIGALAFAEATALDPDGGWRETAERSIRFLVDAQKRNPSGIGAWGWRYASRTEIEAMQKKGLGADPSDADRELAAAELADADTSVTGWAVAALRAGERAGIDVPQAALDGAADFLEYVSKSDGRVGYLTPEGAGVAVTGPRDVFHYHVASMSALGMIILWDDEREKPHPFFEAAAKQIVKDLPAVSKDKLSVDYYYWYQASIALNTFDAHAKGKKKQVFSGPWNKALVEAAVPLQHRSEGVCSHGGWIIGDRWAYAGGPIYATALNVLSLEACTRPQPAPSAFAPTKKK